jgi:hypothetical protein
MPPGPLAARGGLEGNIHHRTLLILFERSFIFAKARTAFKKSIATKK